jgi:TPR repeat protein
MGDAQSQRGLGWMYQTGNGVTQDNKAAIKWYTLAAEQEDADAQHKLGLIYESGGRCYQELPGCI